MNEFKPASFSPQSGPRFPHPQTAQNLPTNIPARQSEPFVGTPQRSQSSPQNPIGNITDNQEYGTFLSSQKVLVKDYRDYDLTSVARCKFY